MSTEVSTVVLAALLDGISLLQGEIAALTESNSRIEDSQRVILDRLDTIDAGQAAVTDILPVLEAILGRVMDNQVRTDAGYESVVKVLGALSDGQQQARDEVATIVPVLEAISSDAKAGRSAAVEGFNQLVPMVDAIGTNVSADSAAIKEAVRPLAIGVEKLLELAVVNGEDERNEVSLLAPAVAQVLANQVEDRELSRAGFKKVSTIAAFSYAAASGRGGPLPVDVEDDPLMERFIIAQPANLASEERALTDWQATVRSEGTAELTAILKDQYTPSPTDTPETRVLRYRMAAITRATIEGRGAAAPKPPTTTRPGDRSAAACMIRSQQLARIWRAGESTALFADPELAGAFDLFVLASRRAQPIPEGKSTPELAAFHGELAALIESGSRPTLADALFPRTAERMIEPEAERDR
jgi:hypothetical protein